MSSHGDTWARDRVRVRVRVRAWVSYLAVDDVVLVHDAHALLEVGAVLDRAAQRHEGDLVVPAGVRVRIPKGFLHREGTAAMGGDIPRWRGVTIGL